MKGLLLKDWYVAVKYCRIHFAIVPLMSVMSLWIDTGMLYLLYPLLFAGMIPVYVLSVDEKFGWSRYVQTMPVSRRAIVSSTYVEVLITVGGAVLFMTALWLGKFVLSGGGSGAAALLRTMGLILCLGLMLPALMLPAMLRLGVEKGRVVSLAYIVLVMLLMVLAMIYVGKGAPEGMETAYVLDVVGRSWQMPALGLVFLVLFALSWLLAIRLYEKREL